MKMGAGGELGGGKGGDKITVGLKTVEQKHMGKKSRDKKRGGGTHPNGLPCWGHCCRGHHL